MKKTKSSALRAQKAYYEREKAKGIRPHCFLINDEMAEIIRKIVREWRNKLRKDA